MKLACVTAGLVSAALLAPAAVMAAGQTAGAVNANAGVSTNTQIKADATNPPSATTFVKDSAITAKIKTQLAAEKISSLAKVSVDTDQNGTVVLSGTVDDPAVAMKAETIARSTDGVKQVQNRITVKKS